MAIPVLRLSRLFYPSFPATRQIRFVRLIQLLQLRIGNITKFSIQLLFLVQEVVDS